ncbi:MAG TPA: hypothetical protein VF490_22395 [Chryseosolibacter sp.]
MVEVFRTNVHDYRQAAMLIEKIQSAFSDYTANFDLEDCDKILRVKSAKGPIQSSTLIGLLRKFGFDAEVLPDDIPVDEVLTLL